MTVPSQPPRGRRPRLLARWAGVGVAVGALSLLQSLFGLAWDIAWHIDRGRDTALLTPPHVLTLTGLAGFGLAGSLAILLATADGYPGGARLGPVVVPATALPIVAMALVSTLGFPLDDRWHAAYGIDVTLWSPTHLVMIGGAILSTAGFTLMAAEGGLFARPARAALAGPRRLLAACLFGGILLAFSTLQFEYDFGVPQWRPVLQPALIGATAAFALTAARAATGRGGALMAALAFLSIRALLTIAVGPLLGHQWPRLPLYVVSAVAVELAFAVPGAGRRGLGLAGACGVAIATLGMAGEAAWNEATAVLPWSPSLLAQGWIPLLATLGAAVPGLALGRALAGRPPALPAWAVAGGVLLCAAAVAAGLPSGGSGASATITTTAVGAPRIGHDRAGAPARVQDVLVRVRVSPEGAAARPDWFVVESWQGGGRATVPLRRQPDGTWLAAAPVPTGGSWKAIVYLAEGGVLAAAPVSMPADPEYRYPGVELAPERTSTLVPAASLLTTEAHPGPPAVAFAAYLLLAVAVATWAAMLLHAAVSVQNRTNHLISGTPAF